MDDKLEKELGGEPKEYTEEEREALKAALKQSFMEATAEASSTTQVILDEMKINGINRAGRRKAKKILEQNRKRK